MSTLESGIERKLKNTKTHFLQEEADSKTSNKRHVVHEISEIHQPNTEVKERVPVFDKKCGIHLESVADCNPSYVHVQRHGCTHVRGKIIVTLRILEQE